MKHKHLSKIDPWFLSHIFSIAELENIIKDKELTPELLLAAKKMGFSDRALGRLKNKSEQEIRNTRHAHNIVPYVKQIDTLAGEFAAQTNYFI